VSIDKIFSHNFRNLNNDLIEFDSKINLFIGDNTAGKTSIIELIYYTLHNKSFKTTNLKDVIKHKEKSLAIQALIKNKQIEINKTYDKSIININKQQTNTIGLNKLLPCQLISPDRGFIVGGSNNNKRIALNWGLFHVEHSFAKLFTDYKKIHKNINFLIANKQKQDLSIWFKYLAEIITKINQKRQNYIQELQNINTNNYFDSTKMDLTNFSYTFNNGLSKSVTNTTDDIYNFFMQNIDLILKNKYLKYGIHLANIDFYLDEINEKNLSRGQQKTLSLVFWFKQVLHLISLGKKPIVLIDDIAAELDNNKIELVLNFLSKNNIQSFITNINKINYDAKIYNVKSGKIEYN
jgi:DNA replication and repair protein RecF